MKHLFLLVTGLLAGCVAVSPLDQTSQTIGSKVSGYTYVPLDPLRIEQVQGENCALGASYEDLLPSLPDNSVRISIKSRNAKSNATFTPVSVGYAGNHYQVVLDYVQTDTSNIRFIRRPDGTQTAAIYDVPTFPPLMAADTDSHSPEEPEPVSFVLTQNYQRVPTGAPERLNTLEAVPPGATAFNIPVYVGVGLRLTADVSVLKGDVNLADLGALSASAEAGRSVGTLTVQTLGLSGKLVTTNLPLPKQINQNSVEDAILALGKIKAVLYNGEADVHVMPRVTGIYLPFSDGDEKTVNQIVSQLAAEPIVWYRPCKS